MEHLELRYSVISMKQLVCIFLPFSFCAESGFKCNLNSNGNSLCFKYI